MGNHFMSVMLALKAICEPPVPHKKAAATAPTKPMAAKTRCPVSMSSPMDANSSRAVVSCERVKVKSSIVVASFTAYPEPIAVAFPWYPAALPGCLPQ